ncbi:MAG: DUF2461 domain-containing protein [Saprospiraceae bacterium]
MTHIESTSFQFLQNLIVNNNRDWFNENKPRYELAKANMKAFGNSLLEKMNKIDHIERLKIHRIYRDVRFSKDKTPYKRNLSCSMDRATKLLRGGYYLHIEPDECFLGGGFWGPNKDDLSRIRKELAFDAQPLRDIINSEDFKNMFGELKGDQLKTAPRGYPKDHENVDLLRYKQYIVMRKFTNEEVTQAGFLQKVVAGFQAMRPFFDYMSEVLTTDENGVPIV